jgi:hypothetical protein
LALNAQVHESLCRLLASDWKQRLTRCSSLRRRSYSALESIVKFHSKHKKKLLRKRKVARVL